MFCEKDFVKCKTLKSFRCYTELVAMSVISDTHIRQRSEKTNKHSKYSPGSLSPERRFRVIAS